MPGEFIAIEPSVLARRMGLDGASIGSRRDFVDDGGSEIVR